MAKSSADAIDRNTPRGQPRFHDRTGRRNDPFDDIGGNGRTIDDRPFMHCADTALALENDPLGITSEHAGGCGTVWMPAELLFERDRVAGLTTGEAMPDRALFVRQERVGRLAQRATSARPLRPGPTQPRAMCSRYICRCDLARAIEQAFAR
ncbi:hypothetical protein [Sphingomonas gellani]|uniref:hypothetical protein n=1 Tax=Sphingomonas gellani TaxID=1166340 RepID=UPI001113511E|nr:hypothetical protein [Sphingomonas gellani]